MGKKGAKGDPLANNSAGYAFCVACGKWANEDQVFSPANLD
jgi:hypothetical protein